MYVDDELKDEVYEELSDPERFEKEILLKTTFIKECKQLPLEHLNKKERKLVNKCINKNPMNDKEIDLLRDVLGKYRPAIDKYKPEEKLGFIDEAKDLIKTEEEFIRLMEQAQEEITLDVRIGKTTHPMTFVIHSISNSSAFVDLLYHLRMFEDIGNELSEEEKRIYDKAEEEMNEYEQQIADKLDHDINKRLADDGMIDTLLINAVSLKDSNPSLKQREKFWSLVPIDTKMTLYYAVLEYNGLTGDMDLKLFQS